MKNFILPNMYENYNLNFKVLNLQKNHPEYFKENTKIYSVYGNFQFCIWDGGRIFNNMSQTSKEKIEFILKRYSEYGVKIRYIFTNPMVEKEHYNNRFCNLILELSKDYDIELVVNNAGLENYIRQTYPSFHSYISSTTKCLNNFDEMKSELQDPKYSMLCFDYNLNKNKNIFELPLNLIQKSELLCNAICAPGCPYRKNHYRLNGIYNLQYGKPYTMSDCFIKENTLHPNTFNFKNNISPEDIEATYEPAGFQFFKLEGRTLSEIENICNYVRYLIRPEYQFYVIAELMK